MDWSDYNSTANPQKACHETCKATSNQQQNNIKKQIHYCTMRPIEI
ncbi:hypothetical protein [Methanobrevibacter ruminantium]|nr:hypothetical protein [Methanobrevibacter ruminantium]